MIVTEIEGGQGWMFGAFRARFESESAYGDEDEDGTSCPVHRNYWR